MDQNEYLRRCRENKEAIERIQGGPMSVEDEQQLGLMVYRIMRAEQAITPSAD